MTRRLRQSSVSFGNETFLPDGTIMAENPVKPDIEGTLEIDGVHIHYEYFGEKIKPTIILMNGVAMETRSWYLFLPLLVDQTDVLLWDYRGQGQSTSDDADYDIGAHAGYLRKIIETVGLKPEKTNLLGISSGSIFGAEFLRQHSHLANRAVLSGALLTPEKPFIKGCDLGIKMLREGQLDYWIDSLYSSLFSDGFLEVIEPHIPKMKIALKERYSSRVLALSRIIEAQKNYLLGMKERCAGYKKIMTPTLLLAGEHDILTPPFVQKKLLDMFGTPLQYLEMPQAGHMLAMERSKDFFGKAVEFVLG